MRREIFNFVCDGCDRSEARQVKQLPSGWISVDVSVSLVAGERPNGAAAGSALADPLSPYDLCSTCAPLFFRCVSPRFWPVGFPDPATLLPADNPRAGAALEEVS